MKFGPFMCFNFVLLLQNPKRQKAKGAYVKFVSHWQKMASAQILCLNSLGDADLLQYTDRPSVLIQKLYEHPSITQLEWNSGAPKPGRLIKHVFLVRLSTMTKSNSCFSFKTLSLD